MVKVTGPEVSRKAAISPLAFDWKATIPFSYRPSESIRLFWQEAMRAMEPSAMTIFFIPMDYL